MSCVPSDPRFRLLDHIVGWDAATHEQLVGLRDSEGVRLAGGGAGISAMLLDPYLPPPPLAPGCDPCEWYLVCATTPAISRLDGCSNVWQAPWSHGCLPICLQRPVAIAVDRGRIAIADAGADRIWVLLRRGAQVVAEIPVPQPRDVTFGPNGNLVAICGDGAELRSFGFNGRPLGAWSKDMLAAEPLVRVGHDRRGRLWLATEVGDGRYELWSWNGSSFEARTIEDLSRAFDPLATVRSDRRGFCLVRSDRRGVSATLCWDWCGEPIGDDCVGSGPSSAFALRGQLLTHGLDSGIPRCRWHRIALDGDVPAGSRIHVAVASSEEPAPARQGVSENGWEAFEPGAMHPDDWQTLSPGQTDALIRCPPGRYLFLRLRLEGDGAVTPRVRRIHIDFPRATSADLLPTVYRQDPVSADFTERFLSLFDGALGSVDAAVSRFPALIDGARARDEVLPWVASFLSVTLDAGWDAETRRRLLAAAPDLFRRRGTRSGLIRSLVLAYDLQEEDESLDEAALRRDRMIVEHGLERAWAAVGDPDAPRPSDARLGRARLFSRRAARLTLGASPLGQTPVLSYGDPAGDADRSGAFRFSVTVPPGSGSSRDALARLVEGQKPAHTLADLQVGTTHGFLLGGALRLGIDTLVKRPEHRVLGAPGTRLAHNTILGGQAPPGPVLGLSALTDPQPAVLPMSCPE